MPERPPPCHFIVPGPLDTPTGGYAYDRRIVEGLRAAGGDIRVVELQGAFPFPDAQARRAAELAFAALPDGAITIVDGLAGGALPEELGRHSGRLRLVALVHHPLHRETGLSGREAACLHESESAALAHARRIVTTSATTARCLADDFPAVRERIAVVRPGTDRAPLASRDRKDGALAMLCVASLIPRKGHLDLLAALERIDSTDWRLVCAGSAALMPDYAQRIEDAHRRHPHRERITFRGAVPPEALASLYAETDLFVLASHYEGYGMVLTEAIARGVPVLATTGGAIPEAVPDGAGLLVPPGDTAALAEALESVIGDAARLQGLRDGALQARRALPSWEDAVDAFRDVLSALEA